MMGRQLVVNQQIWVSHLTRKTVMHYKMASFDRVNFTMDIGATKKQLKIRNNGLHPVKGHLLTPKILHLTTLK